MLRRRVLLLGHVQLPPRRRQIALHQRRPGVVDRPAEGRLLLRVRPRRIGVGRRLHRGRRGARGAAGISAAGDFVSRGVVTAGAAGCTGAGSRFTAGGVGAGVGMGGAADSTCSLCVASSDDGSGTVVSGPGAPGATCAPAFCGAGFGARRRLGRTGHQRFADGEPLPPHDAGDCQQQHADRGQARHRGGRVRPPARGARPQSPGDALQILPQIILRRIGCRALSRRQRNRLGHWRRRGAGFGAQSLVVAPPGPRDRASTSARQPVARRAAA